MLVSPRAGGIGLVGHVVLRAGGQDDAFDTHGAADDAVRPGNGREQLLQGLLAQLLLDGGIASGRVGSGLDPELLGERRFRLEQLLRSGQREQPRGLVPSSGTDVPLDLGGSVGERTRLWPGGHSGMVPWSRAAGMLGDRAGPDAW